MTAVQVDYYTSSSAEAKALIKEAHDKLMAHIRAKDQLNTTLVGADHVYAYRGNVLGFAFDAADANARPADRAGLKFWRKDETGGLTIHIYKPDAQSVRGSNMIAAIKALGGYDTSTWLIGKLGIDLSGLPAISELPKPGLCNSLAVYAGGTLFVQIPVLPGGKTPPKWLRKVLANEFYAQMQAAQEATHTRVRAAIAGAKKTGASV